MASQFGATAVHADSIQQAQALRSSEEVIFADDWPAEEVERPPVGIFTLLDMVAQIRLTHSPCEVDVIGERLQLVFLQPEINAALSQPNPSFEILCAPYYEG